MLPLNVLIGCECSSIVRDAFIALGHNAWSCDLKPSEGRQGNHLQGDVRWTLDGMLHKFPDARDIRTGYAPMFRKWDMAIFHPDCRFLCNSGALRLYRGGKKANGPDPERWQNMREAALFFRELWNAPIEHIALENPIQHGYAIEVHGLGPQTQLIQPWWFGDDASKMTGLWLRRLPELISNRAQHVAPRMVNRRPRWSNQTDSGQNKLAPSATRSADRARTYPGIAAAMAQQWGRYVQLHG